MNEHIRLFQPFDTGILLVFLSTTHNFVIQGNPISGRH